MERCVGVRSPVTVFQLSSTALSSYQGDKDSVMQRAAQNANGGLEQAVGWAAAAY